MLRYLVFANSCSSESEIYLELSLETNKMLCPDIFDVISDCCSVWDIRVLEVTAQ